MSNEATRYTNWGAITVLATGLDSAEKIKSAIIDLAQERFEIQIKGNPRFNNATTGYVLSRDGELARWEYVGHMEPMGDQIQIMTIGPDVADLDGETEESYYEEDDASGRVPRNEEGRITSQLVSVHEVIDDVEVWMADAVEVGIDAWENWENCE